MSWFYEALLRAEKERPKSGNGTRARMPGQDGESFLAPIESLPSIAAGGFPSKPEIPSSEPLPTVENPATPRPVLSRPDIRGEAGSSSNGFRHLTLPLSEESRLVFQTDPGGMPAEQFRLLRRTLRQGFAAGAVLMITSPGAGDGKTLTCLNLSACLASSGDTTLLVEADIRRPTLRNICGDAIESPGIEDAWAGKAEPRQAIHLIEELSLHMALVAKVPDNPSRLINGPGVRQFIAWARENFHWVVMDCPPALPTADVAGLLPLADAALLVIRAQSTPRELSRRAFELLGTRLHGVIFNAATVDSNPYYGYLGPHYQGVGTKKASQSEPQ
jgi:Mrp family chromosome partitioning ATPase